MDDIKTRTTRGEYTRRQVPGRPVPPRLPLTPTPEPKTTEAASTIRLVENNDIQQQKKHVETKKLLKADNYIVIHLPKWLASIRRYIRKHKVIARVAAAIAALVIVFSLGYEFYQQRQTAVVYNFTGNETNLLSEPSPILAQKLKYDTKTATYIFNEGYSAQSNSVASSKNGPKITASFGTSADKSVKVTDPTSNVSITLKPRFAVAEPKQDQNRIVYPLIGKHVSAVYSLGSVGVKEDLPT